MTTKNITLNIGDVVTYQGRKYECTEMSANYEQGTLQFSFRKREDLPKLTHDELEKRGIKWPEWAKFAYSMGTFHSLFSENDPRSCIEDYSLHPPVDIPGQWEPGGFIERPAKLSLPDWCKVGKWVFAKDSAGASWRGRITEVKDTHCVICGGLFFPIKDCRPAEVAPWDDKGASAFVGSPIRFHKTGATLVMLGTDGKGNAMFPACGQGENIYRISLRELAEAGELLNGRPCGVLFG